MKTAVIVLADGFEEVEAVTPADLLRRAGVSVVMAGLTGLPVRGRSKIELTCDRLIAEVPRDWDLLILPGGLPGAQTLSNSPLVLELIDDTLARQSWVAAICAAPALVLGRHGYLAGRDYTGYPGTESSVSDARYRTDAVVVDGPFVTSRGVGTALSFSLQLIELLMGSDKAKEIGRSVLSG